MLKLRIGIALIGTISAAFGIFFRRNRVKRKVKEENEELKVIRTETEMFDTEYFNRALFFPCYFPESPDSSIAQLMNILGAAKKTLDISVMTIAYKPLIQLLINKQRQGIQVRIYTSYNTQKSRGGQFRKHGIQVRSKQTRYSTAMHNKYVIIDNYVILTGSLNWTKIGILNSKENVLVLSDCRIVSKYIKEFANEWEIFDEYPPKPKPAGSTPEEIPWSYANYMYKCPIPNPKSNSIQKQIQHHNLTYRERWH